MGLISVLRLNNQPYNWNSSLSRFMGQAWPGVVEVNYSEKLDIETVYSQTQDGKPIGGTSGQYEVDSFTVKMLIDDADALTTMLVASAPQFLGSYGRVEFPFTLSVTEPLLPGAIPIEMIAGVCRIRGKKKGVAKGIEALVTEFDIWCKGIIENGKTLYSTAIPTL
jgi:hypothetical protein